MLKNIAKYLVLILIYFIHLFIKKAKIFYFFAKNVHKTVDKMNKSY